MSVPVKKYTLPELKVGMTIVNKSQLSEIYDTWILLVKQAEDTEYTIGFIGKETNTESDKLFKPGNQICPVYNDSMELEEDIFCDE